MILYKKTFSSNFIATNELERYEFLISKVDGGYTIYSTSKGAYIGHSGSSNNDLKTSSSTPYVHKISIDSSGYALITIGGYTLQYNSASNALCFRYYTSNQKPIMLYKYDGDNCENKNEILINENNKNQNKKNISSKSNNKFELIQAIYKGIFMRKQFNKEKQKQIQARDELATELSKEYDKFPIRKAESLHGIKYDPKGYYKFLRKQS